MLTRHAVLIAELAAELGCTDRALRAVIRVEAAGEGLCDGRPVIRLEVHHLWRGVPSELRSAVDASYQVGGPRPWEGHRYRQGSGSWVDLHQPGRAGQALEWEALGAARAIHDEAAIGATSWGAGQLLGRHWRALGYASPQALVSAQYDEREQLRAMARYLRDVAGAGPALAVLDWPELARRYNGPGQVAWYAARLEAAYARG